MLSLYNRSATGGLPVKQSLQRGLLHLLLESQQTKGPHLTSTAGAGGHTAAGMLLADPFSGFIGMRANGEPFLLETAAAVGFSQGKENASRLSLQLLLLV